MKWRTLPGLSEIVAVVQKGIAIIIKSTAMKGIGTTLQRLIHNRAGIPRKLRIQGTSNNVNFRQSIRIDGYALIL